MKRHVRMLAVVMAAALAFSSTPIYPVFATGAGVAEAAHGQQESGLEGGSVSPEPTSEEKSVPEALSGSEVMASAESDEAETVVSTESGEAETVVSAESGEAETVVSSESETESGETGNREDETEASGETDPADTGDGKNDAGTSGETDPDGNEDGNRETEGETEAGSAGATNPDGNKNGETGSGSENNGNGEAGNGNSGNGTPGETKPGDNAGIPGETVKSTPSDALGDAKGDGKEKADPDKAAGHSMRFVSHGGKDYVSVYVDLPEGTSLPDGTKLKVKALTPETNEYETAMAAILDALALPEDTELNARLYDIHFALDGVEVEPDAGGRVTVNFRGSSRNVTRRTVVQVCDDDTAEVLDVEWSDEAPADEITEDDDFYGGASRGVTSVRFDVDSFSVFGFVEDPDDSELNETPDRFIFKMNDGTVVAAVPQDDTALPVVAKLRVDEVDAERAEETTEAARSALDVPEDKFLRFLPFDIYFVGADGEKVEPNGAVDVTLKYPEDPFADKKAEADGGDAEGEEDAGDAEESTGAEDAGTAEDIRDEEDARAAENTVTVGDAGNVENSDKSDKMEETEGAEEAGKMEYAEGTEETTGAEETNSAQPSADTEVIETAQAITTATAAEAIKTVQTTEKPSADAEETDSVASAADAETHAGVQTPSNAETAEDNEKVPDSHDADPIQPTTKLTHKYDELFALHETADGSIEKLDMTRRKTKNGVTFKFTVKSFSLMGPATLSTQRRFTCELDDGTVVTVVLGEETKLPEDAELHAAFLENDDPRMAEIMETLREAMGLTEEDYMNPFPCDIYFTDANGDRIDTEGKMRVTVKFGSRFADTGWGSEDIRPDADDTVEATESDRINDDDTLDADGIVEAIDSDYVDEDAIQDDKTADDVSDSVRVSEVICLDADGAAQVLESDWVEDRSSVVFDVYNPPASDYPYVLTETAGATVAWGDISDDDKGKGVTQTVENNDCVWDVSASTKRYFDVSVQINVAADKDITITLPKYIAANIRNKESGGKAVVSTDAVGQSLCKVTEEEEKILLDFDASTGAGLRSFKLPYHFDCWNVVSNELFEIEYTIQESGKEGETGKLQGKIKTGFGFEIVNDYTYMPDSYYSNAYGRDNGYSLNSLGGADSIMSYIQNCSSVYSKYFKVGDFGANIAVPDENGGYTGGDYIYDIAPFFVKPSGQQPYDISGTVTVKNGEVLAGVYMMDSRLGAKAPWKLLTDTDNIKDNNSFTFNFSHNDEFDWQEKDGTKPSLIDKVVTGNLTDTVDNKFYTLYFLVRYKISDLGENQQREVNKNGTPVTAYILDAKINLTHTGVDVQTDSKPAVNKEKNQLLYRGPITDPQIYDAYYTYCLTKQQDALSTLDAGGSAYLDFEADFFCFNEERYGFQVNNNDKYRLEAVIDLLYLTEERPYEKSQQLATDDYRFSQFTLSLVDAPGSWSQNWYYEDCDINKPEDDEVWTERRPNIGWPVETWDHGKKELEGQGYSQVIVYGSTTHEGNEWTKIKDFDVWDLWAKDKGRDVNHAGFGEGENKTNQFTIPTKDYVRLKVEYDSRFTTALRLRYQIELKHNILNEHAFLKTGTDHGLTSWFNYFGYTKAERPETGGNGDWNADTGNMNLDAYYKSDADWKFDYTWEDEQGTSRKGDRGSVEQARQYDNTQSEKMDFATNFNTDKTDRYAKTYSMRDYVRTLLGRSDDMAGMLVTQAIYDAKGTIVGNNTNSTQLNGGSFSKEKTVTDVSEIVYSISGGITQGYLNTENLKNRRQDEKVKNSNSPYNSLKMRYFVLLPIGFKLNKSAQPQYNTPAAPLYLTATPTFYNNQKATGSNNTVVTSYSNIPAWQEESANGALSEMKWNEAGKVTLNEELTKGQLFVFERELEDATLEEVFNLHGATTTYFWGRGFSFSIVPERGTGSIRTGTYETKFWCQYLGKDDKPISLNGFRKNIDGNGSQDVKADELNNSLDKNSQQTQEEDTLLYIPSGFENNSPVGTSGATITLESNNLDKEGKAIQDENGNYVLQFGKDYAYKLDFSSPERKDEDVVLWTNIEREYNSDPQYRGTVTGVDISQLPVALQQCVEVYVKKDDFFNPSDYVGAGETAANQSWLTNPEKKWEKVPEDELTRYNRSQVKAVAHDELTGYDWSEVKAVAFSFGAFEFNKYSEYDTVNDPNDIEGATVMINMKAPKREGDYLKLDGELEKTFDAISRLYLSDKRDGGNTGCAFAGEVPVSVTTVRPIGFNLNKVDGSNNNQLNGAAFKLKRWNRTANPEADGDDERNNVDGNSSAAIEWAIVEKEENGAGEGIPKYVITGWTTTEGDATEMPTGQDGKLQIVGFRVFGIKNEFEDKSGSGTYYVYSANYALVETKIPETYQKTDDIIFTVEITVGADKKLRAATLYYFDTNKIQNGTEASFMKHSMMDDKNLPTMQVKNYKSPILPRTGGIGRMTVILVSAAAVLFGGLILFFATRRKKKDRRSARTARYAARRKPETLLNAEGSSDGFRQWNLASVRRDTGQAV